MCSMINNQCPNHHIPGFTFTSHYDCVEYGYRVAHGTFKSLEEIEPKQDSMQQQIDTNTNSIQSLIQGQQDQANDASGMDSDNPPTDISGLD